MSKTLVEFGLPAVFQVGGEDIVAATWAEVAHATHTEAMQLLGLGLEEMIIGECSIFENADEVISLGILDVEEVHCAGHYPSCKILPLHWGFNYLSQCGSLLLKYMRRAESILPQTGLILNAKGTDFVKPKDKLRGIARIKKVMRDGVAVDLECFRNGDSTSIMTARLLMTPDLTLNERPANVSWQQILDKAGE